MPTAQPFWDPAGEFEPHTTIYTITVFCPRRPPPKYVPSFFTREPVRASPHHVIRSDDSKPNYDYFRWHDLGDMKTEVVQLKAYQFPFELRCEHVNEGKARICKQGCYVLEKGGKVSRQRCKRPDCEGHVYCDPVKETEEEKWQCFGKKGKRIVALK